MLSWYWVQGSMEAKILFPWLLRCVSGVLTDCSSFLLFILLRPLFSSSSPLHSSLTPAHSSFLLLLVHVLHTNAFHRFLILITPNLFHALFCILFLRIPRLVFSTYFFTIPSPFIRLTLFLYIRSGRRS